jgi:hypothetical protein
MKRLLILIATTSIFLLFFTSCYYDNEEALYPDIIPCDSINVTFSGSITPILSSNCLCHSNKNAAKVGNKTFLENYTDVSASIDLILPAIKHEGRSPKMPNSGGKINDCYIKSFERWKKIGMPNN